MFFCNLNSMDRSFFLTLKPYTVSVHLYYFNEKNCEKKTPRGSHFFKVCRCPIGAKWDTLFFNQQVTAPTQTNIFVLKVN